jgi:hypothetical protein
VRFTSLNNLAAKKERTVFDDTRRRMEAGGPTAQDNVIRRSVYAEWLDIGAFNEGAKRARDQSAVILAAPKTVSRADVSVNEEVTP